MPKPVFRFKLFSVQQDRCAMKVGTDSVLFGAWVGHGGAQRILDIGTGTGVLALIAAQRNPAALIDAVEIEDAAAEQAAANVQGSPWAGRIRVHRMDVRRLHASAQYDLIICNPPYYAGYSTSPDPRLGLAKHSGELVFDELLDAAGRLLAVQGRLAVVIPLNREQAFLKQGLRVGLSPQRRCVVRYVAHRPPKRVMLELARDCSTRREETLTVEATGPFDYTPEYRALVSELMLTV